MTKMDRALRRDFLEFMHVRNAWPKGYVFEEWVRQRDVIRTGVYGQMKQGFAVAPRCAVALCAYFLAKMAENKEKEFCAAFVDYLCMLGIENPSAFGAHALAVQLFAPDDEDYLQRDTLGTLEIVKTSRAFKKYVVACSNEKQVCEAVRWTYIGVGRHLEMHNPTVPIRRAIELAEDHMRLPMSDYQERAVAWWRFDRWTVVRSRGKRAPTGMSIVLPLREPAYDFVRGGNRMSYDTPTTELQRPSRHLLIESIFERPVELGGEKGNVTKHLLMTVVRQVAVLTRCHGRELRKPLRLLSFGGTPKNQQRLMANGYKRVNARMPGTDIEFFERIVSWANPKHTVLRGFLIALAFQADDMLHPPLSKHSDEPSE